MNFINKSLIKGEIMKKIIISSLLLLIISCSESKEFEINKMIQLYHDYGQFNGAVLVASGR